jgi:hypothetical protein
MTGYGALRSYMLDWPNREASCDQTEVCQTA